MRERVAASRNPQRSMMAAVGGRGYGNDSRKNAPFGLRGSNSPLLEVIPYIWGALIIGTIKHVSRTWSARLVCASKEYRATLLSLAAKRTDLTDASPGV